MELIDRYKELVFLYESYEREGYDDEDEHLELIEKKEKELFEALHATYGVISMDNVNEYLASSHAADFLGWSRQKLSNQRRRGTFPEPDAISRNRPYWSRETLEKVKNKEEKRWKPWGKNQ